MYSLYIKFQEKIFTGKKIIQLWNFGNFGMLEIIPKILVTLKFSKISVHELKGCSKCFQMMYWPHFYVDPSHSNTYFLKNFLKLTVSHGINLQSLNMKFQEKIFTTIKIIQLWNFGNFGMPEIIPKNLSTLRFSKVWLYELKGSCNTFQMRYWPSFYVDPAYSNTYFFKLTGGYAKQMPVV